MGSQSVNKFTSPESKKKFTRLLLNDIQAMDSMLKSGLIESGIQRIGAEQELCLLDENFGPATNNMEVLAAINDPHFVPEIAKFNIEANLDPFEFTGDCFDQIEDQLRGLLNKAFSVTEKLNTKILMTGILPTLRKEHLDFDHMTPNERYQALNEIMRNQKGSDFELNIMAIDELITTHENILFEACTTSFQVHMQIEPNDFTKMYNWAQMIAGPVVAVAANSPLLLGKRLWKETRIALFQQSVDTRPINIKREQEPRVTFGKEWASGTAVDIFRDNISRFNLLFATDEKEDSLAVLEKGGIPQLEALKMHNSTVYKWNRACYGVGGGKPHLRIENRYIPSGPTVLDELANAAFWLGIMNSMPEEYENLPEMVPFEDCRYNFYNACRNGLDCQFKWFDKTVSAQKLIKNTLLPMAREGLLKAKINPRKIDQLLDVIEKRVSKNKNGSKWMIKNFTILLDKSTAYEASRSITEAMYHNQLNSRPVHKWRDIDPTKIDTMKRFGSVRDVMERELYIAKEDDLIDLVINMMDWKNIRSIPVENSKHELVGLITVKDILHYHTKPQSSRPELVSEIMQTDFVSIPADTSTEEAVSLLAKTRACCLLVTQEKALTGIITESDIVQVANMTKAFKK
ncbi:MAG: CBS domain-containing protein [Bacteroidia bacterium]